MSEPRFEIDSDAVTSTIEEICDEAAGGCRALRSPVNVEVCQLAGQALSHLVTIITPSVVVDATADAVADHVEDWSRKLKLAADAIRERYSA